MKPSERLASLERFGWRFGLDSIRCLLQELGNPEKGLKVLHVAGSNGKGSTCAYLASILRQAGYRTGLYTSPHLTDIRERFRIDGEWIPARDLDRLAGKVLNACQRVRRERGHSPTHFEALTALAFLWFHEKRTDFVVLEVGLGGRLDATNVMEDPVVCLITPVSLEHQDILGKTLAKIAWEKAGILKAGRLAATLQTDPGAMRVIRKRARQVGAPLWIIQPGVSLVSLLPGSFGHQMQNAALAVAGIRLLEGQGIRVGERAIQRGLVRMRWPGRLEVIRKKPTILLDGAHNPAGAKALAGALKKKYPGKKWIVLNGFLGDKSYRDCIGHLESQALLSIVTEPPSDRKRPGRGVFETWEKSSVPVLWVKDWQEALGLGLAKAEASGAGLLITGSLYLVGACRGALVGKQGLEKI